MMKITGCKSLLLNRFLYYVWLFIKELDINIVLHTANQLSPGYLMAILDCFQ